MLEAADKWLFHAGCSIIRVWGLCVCLCVCASVLFFVWLVNFCMFVVAAVSVMNAAQGMT